MGSAWAEPLRTQLLSIPINGWLQVGYTIYEYPRAQLYVGYTIYEYPRAQGSYSNSKTDSSLSCLWLSTNQEGLTMPHSLVLLFALALPNLETEK